MPLKVSDGIGAWIKDFKKSDAPQFKGKSEKERRDQAVAAYLSAKRGPQKEAETRASADKKPEEYVGPDGKTKIRMVPTKKKVDEEFVFKVEVEGLPDMFMKGNSPGQVKTHLRKLVKQPSMVKSVERQTKHDVKKQRRKQAVVGENRRDVLRKRLAMVGKDMKKTNKELKKTVGIKDEPKKPFKGKYFS